MEISKERLVQLSKTNAKARVMVKQWYPEVFEDDKGVIDFLRAHWIDSVISEAIDIREPNTTSSSGLEISNITQVIPNNFALDSGSDINGNSLIVNKWYTNGNEYLMIYNEDRETKGFYGGSWGSQWSFTGTACQSRPATAVEIGHYLKRECAIRGYSIESDGTSNFVGLGIASQTPRYPISEWYYDIRNDSLYTAPLDMGGFVVYRGGEWARLKTDVQFYG